MPDNAPEADAREFAAQFRSFLDWIHSANREDARSEVSTLVGDFLGRDGAAQSVVTRELAPFEHVNLQTALDAWSARAGRTVEVRGLTLPPHHAPFALGHCRILEIGDSLGDDLEYGLRHELQFTPGLKLIQRNKTSTGLSASWFYNWPAHLKSDLRAHHPNLVVIMIGANDEQALDVGGVSRPFGSPKWRSAYIARVRRIDRLVTKAGAYAFWVGLPIAAPKQYSQGLRALNAIYRQVAISTPGVTFQPMWHLLATKGGNYRGGADVNGVQSALRVSDGIHFTSTGELVIGTFIARQLATVYNVKLRLEEPAYIDR